MEGPSQHREAVSEAKPTQFYRIVELDADRRGLLGKARMPSITFAK